MEHNAIGGYFGLELPNHDNNIYHDNALALNSGRNAFKSLLEAIRIDKIYVPYFTCEAILEPLAQLNIEYEFYSIDKKLEIDSIIELEQSSYILYINYFGLKDNYIEKLISSFSNVIVDQSQAFFSKNTSIPHSFYSVRKFFGVPDGAFLYSNLNFREPKPDLAFNRSQHLLLRLEGKVEEGYKYFSRVENQFKNRPTEGMSLLTKNILKATNFRETKAKRNNNFQHLHDKLGDYNELNTLIKNSLVNGPMVYPFLNTKINREYLINNKIFVPKYWPNISSWIKNENNFEIHLSNNLIPLPIDQRYEIPEMEKIVKTIFSEL